MKEGRIESIRRVDQTLYVRGKMKNSRFSIEETFLIEATFAPVSGIFLNAMVNGVDILSVFAQGKENWDPWEEHLFDIFSFFSEELHTFYKSGRKYAFLMHIP